MAKNKSIENYPVDMWSSYCTDLNRAIQGICLPKPPSIAISSNGAKNWLIWKKEGSCQEYGAGWQDVLTDEAMDQQALALSIG